MAASKLRFVIVSIFATFYMVSCGTMNRDIKGVNLSHLVTDNSFAKPPIYIHDTVTIRHMSPEQYQAYLQQFYKTNFDKLLAPEFARLNNIINKQANSLQAQSGTITGLSDILANMRARSIHRTDSMQYVNDNLRYSLDAFRKQVSDGQKEQVRQNENQIGQLKNITNFLLWGFASLWGTFLLVVAIFYIWFRKMKRDIKSINYA